MKWRPRVFLILGMLPAFHLARADTVRYTLTDSSAFEGGCFEDCPCPQMHCPTNYWLFPVQGTFQLTQTDPYLRYWDITDIQWTILLNGRTSYFYGLGTYRIGGDFIPLHRVELSLIQDGGPPMYFDSDVQVNCEYLPTIDIVVPMHGYACGDTAFRIVANPTTPASVGPVGDQRGFVVVRPNPFSGLVAVDFGLDRAATVDVSVYDTQGREARSLLRSVRFGNGTHSVAWDGENGNGTPCPPGVYFVRMRAGRNDYLRRVMKLR